MRKQCLLSKDWCVPGKTSRVIIVLLRPPQSHWGAVIVPTVVLLPNCVGDTHCWTITNASALRPATLTNHFFAPILTMRRCMAMLRDAAAAAPAVPLTHRPYASHRDS